MIEKTKANQGASVSKTGNISVQASKPKTQWDQSKEGSETLEACQDNSPHGLDEDPHLQTAKMPMRAKKPAVKHEISEQIGRQLRNVYDDVLAQPVPDRFLDLLRTLEKDHK